MTIHLLVDLVQQAYHARAPLDTIGAPEASSVGAVVYFCTLREALLTAFIRRLLDAKGVSSAIAERLLDDNKLASQKFGKLFASVAGDKWDAAVRLVSVPDGVAFEEVSNLMRAASEVRNQFVHEGVAWSATRDFATQCLNAVPSLVELFASLHNYYVHPLMLGTLRHHPTAN